VKDFKIAVVRGTARAPWTARPAAATGAAPGKTLEARLALGVDLAAIEGLALGLIADDFVSRVQLGEPCRRRLVGLVGIRMQLLASRRKALLTAAGVAFFCTPRIS
jgi:hypothetical protein